MSDNLLEDEQAVMPQAVKANNKPPSLPEKFWDEDSQSVQVEALIQSYLELERRMSNSMQRPETMKDKVEVMRLLGAPQDPADYNLDTSHGLFDVDPDINKRMCDHGFTPEQAQAVYDLAAEKFVPLVFEIAQEFKADREVERLVSAFGGQEKWNEISRQLLSFGKKNLPVEVLETMSGSFEGVMMLFRMMKGQEPSLAPDGSVDVESNGKDDLQVMMRDPRYWREKDPAFVAKVTQGFQRLYSDA